MSGSVWRGMVLILFFLLAGCSLQPTPMPTRVLTPIATASVKPRSGSVTASGKIVPVQQATLSFLAAGRVQQVAVTVGAQVKAGDPLVMQEDVAGQSAVVHAQAALRAAQAQLAAVMAGPQVEAVAAAQAEVDAAQAQLALLTEPARPAELMAARAELTATQAALQQLRGVQRTADRIVARTTLSNTKAVLQQAQLAYNTVAWRSDIDTLPEYWQLQEAMNNYKAAQAHDAALAAAPDADIAAAQARVQQAQAALDHLLKPSSHSQLAAATAQVHAAQAKLALLTAKARAETVTGAEAAVTQAQADLQNAEATLANLTLRAPFTGTVTAVTVNIGEIVQPGAALLTLANLQQLQVATTDLSERDVARVAVGQTATIHVDALGEEIPGRVVRIAAQANVVGGDVVYAVTLALANQPAGLRWGMSVEVELSPSP